MCYFTCKPNGPLVKDSKQGLQARTHKKIILYITYINNSINLIQDVPYDDFDLV